MKSLRVPTILVAAGVLIALYATVRVMTAPPPTPVQEQ